jgi:ParB family chromosome partitioning protein
MSEVRQALVPVQVAPTAPPAAFVEDPAQPRSEFVEDEKYMALVASIRLRGLLQPLIVQRLPAGLLQIRFGARRFRAAITAGLMEIPYLEAHDERQFDDYAQVEENQERLDLQPLDLAQFIERKLAAGAKKKEIAARLHIDPSAVTHLLALAYEPPALLLELYHSQRCRAPHLLYALRNLLRRHGSALEEALMGHQEIDRHRVEALAVMLSERGDGVTAERAGGGGEPVEDVSHGSKRRPAPALVMPGTDGGSAVLPDDAYAGVAGISGPRDCVRLLGHHCGAALELLLDRVPQGEGEVWIRYLDGGRTAEIPLGEIVLTRLYVGPGPMTATVLGPKSGGTNVPPGAMVGVGAGGDTATPNGDESMSK